MGVQISSWYCSFRLLHHCHYPADQDYPSLHPEQVSGDFTLFYTLIFRDNMIALNLYHPHTILPGYNLTSFEYENKNL